MRLFLKFACIGLDRYTVQHKVSLRQSNVAAQADPAAHKRSSDPGMKREWKVKLAWHKGTAYCSE